MVSYFSRLYGFGWPGSPSAGFTWAHALTAPSWVSCAGRLAKALFTCLAVNAACWRGHHGFPLWASHPLIGLTSFLTWRSQGKFPTGQKQMLTDLLRFWNSEYLCCICHFKQVRRPTQISRGREIRLQFHVGGAKRTCGHFKPNTCQHLSNCVSYTSSGRWS